MFLIKLSLLEYIFIRLNEFERGKKLLLQESLNKFKEEFLKENKRKMYQSFVFDHYLIKKRKIFNREEIIADFNELI